MNTTKYFPYQYLAKEKSQKDLTWEWDHLCHFLK